MAAREATSLLRAQEFLARVKEQTLVDVSIIDMDTEMIRAAGDFGFKIVILMIRGITVTLAFDVMADGMKAFGVGNAEFFAQNSGAYGAILSMALLCVFCGAVVDANGVGSVKVQDTVWRAVSEEALRLAQRT